MEQKKETIWSYNFIAVFVIGMFIYMSSYMTNTLLPLYCKELGATDAKVGTIVSMFYTAALLSRPVTGPAMDAFNRKKLLVILSALDVLCFVGYAFAANTTMLVIVRLAHGVIYGTVAALTLTLVSSSLPTSLLSTGLGVFALSYVLPQAVGPGIGLALAENLGYKYAYLAAGGSIMLATAVACTLKTDDRPRSKFVINLNSIFAMEALVPVLVIAISAIASASISSFLVLTVKSRNIEGLELYYTISAIALVILRPPLGKLGDKFGTVRFLPVTLGCYIINMLMLAFCNATWMLWLFGILQAVGYSTSHSMAQALAMKLIPEEKRGSASSSCYLGMDGGMMIGSNLAGLLAEKLGYTGMYVSMTIPLAFSILLLVVWAKKKDLFGKM